MMDNPFNVYYCMNCLSVGELDEQGRCGTCESEAVWDASSSDAMAQDFQIRLAEEAV